MKQKLLWTLLLVGFTLQAEAQTGKNPTEEKKLTLVSDLKLSGFILSQYQYSGQHGAHSNSFNIRMARLSLEGRILRDFFWKTQVQFNGNTATLGQSPRVVDLFAEWQKYKTLRVKFGQFKRPFTFENPLHPIDQGFMSVSQSVTKLSGFADRTGEHASNGRDLGLQVQGDVLPNSQGRALLHYQVGVYNGQGINVKDVDQRKDVIGGVWVMPIKGLRLGVFGWRGSYSRTGSYTIVHPTTHQPVLDGSGNPQTAKGTQTVEKKRYAISGEYVANGWTFRSEYISSKGYGFKTTYNTKADLQDANINYALGDRANGYYALVIMPMMKKQMHLKARLDRYCADGSSVTAKTMYELGADYELTRNLKFSAEYVLVHDKMLEHQNYQMLDFQIGLRF
ncbi:porin [Prevotella sp. oral taxon 475]|uniref:porin n=1 Tax=Prevotella sp. oral taxon 475 TaxID=712471 RepID=UPI001BAB7C70|nr:porin [Prevotella sp. oral taxon 475]QUB46391.1 porin [Prevotella sp. oral taxon 475]